MTDREKIIKGLEWCLFETGCNGCPYRNDCDDGTNMEKDALALLKVQEPVEPTWRRGIPFCGKCGRQFGRGFKYCPDCGQAVKWDG